MKMNDNYLCGTLRSVTDEGIVLKMPASEYGSVKMSLEEWYDHLMICPIGSLSIFICVFTGVKLTFLKN
jgi:hypothetical protein